MTLILRLKLVYGQNRTQLIQALTQLFGAGNFFFEIIAIVSERQ